MWAYDRRQVNQLTVESSNGATVSVEEPDGASADGVKDGAEVRRGAGDDPQDLARGCLLVEGLRQVLVPRLQLLEQPHVLDGDDRLVGEGLEEADVMLSKWCGL